MNERIKELADQILPNEKEWHKGDPKDWGYFFSGDELEKFAELIVRECMDIAYAYDAPKMSGPGMIVANRIEDHFGVEE